MVFFIIFEAFLVDNVSLDMYFPVDHDTIDLLSEELLRFPTACNGKYHI
jgi:hypothetical protein